MEMKEKKKEEAAPCQKEQEAAPCQKEQAKQQVDVKVEKEEGGGCTLSKGAGQERS